MSNAERWLIFQNSVTNELLETGLSQVKQVELSPSWSPFNGEVDLPLKHFGLPMKLFLTIWKHKSSQ